MCAEAKDTARDWIRQNLTAARDIGLMTDLEDQQCRERERNGLRKKDKAGLIDAERVDAMVSEVSEVSPRMYHRRSPSAVVQSSSERRQYAARFSTAWSERDPLGGDELSNVGSNEEQQWIDNMDSGARSAATDWDRTALQRKKFWDQHSQNRYDPNSWDCYSQALRKLDLEASGRAAWAGHRRSNGDLGGAAIGKGKGKQKATDDAEDMGFYWAALEADEDRTDEDLYQ
jgi:hypothetical protein